MNELEKICIYDPAGANYLLGREWEFPITDKCERSAKVMGDDFVRLVFESTHKVVFDAFSFIRYKGQTFFLREKYIPKPKGTFKEDSGDVSTADFSYDVKFVSVANMLDKYVCYRHVVVSGDKGGEWNEPEININGNLETMYKIIMGSIQQVAERLSDHMEFTSMLKTIPANGLNSDGTINTNKVKLTAGTKLLTFNFSGDKIANVCTTVANNFTNDDKKDTEWYITEDNGSLTLHFSKYVDEEYGVQYVSDYISNNNGADSSAHPQKSGGLKDVDYAQEWSGITNVIVPYGSTRNMTYQAAKGIDEVTQMQSTFGKRLRLKPNTYYYIKDKDGKDVSFLTDKQGAVRNSSVDTGIEEVRFYDEIYPQGHFKVTSVETKNKRQDGEIVPEYTVAGVAIDSNGNEIQPAEGFYPIAIEEGATLSVRFEKGLLNGREFEIANKTRKDEGRTTYSLKFTIVADGSLEDGTLIPSGNFIPREGDEFALFNMKMPEVYITAAEKELAQRVYSDLEEAVSKRPEVKCTSDPTAWDKEMALGYQFQVKSEKFNSEDTFVSRVISYSYKLTKPKEIQFNLASAIMQGTLSNMNDLIVDVTNQASGLEQRAINLSRRGWRDAAEMAEMVDSLAADMMLVGNEKYQFAFTAGIEIVNSNNQTTAIKIGEGTLQHTQDPYISDYTCQGWWSHGAVTLNNGHTENGSASLVSLPDTPFYLYAVVGQNSDNISFELQDKEQDGEAYLLLGILSSAFMDTISGVTTNYRVFNRTNGYTQISGGTITTEQIQDAGRNLIIDFQSNPPRIIARNGAEIIGNIKFKASDEKTAEEQLAQLGVDITSALSSIDNLQSQIDGEVTSWFMEGEPSDNYRPANEWTDLVVKERHLGDTYTNILPIEADLSALDSNGHPMWFEQGSLGNTGTTFAKKRKADDMFIRTKCIFELKDKEVVITLPTAFTGKVWLFRNDKTTTTLFSYRFTDATTITLRTKGANSYSYYFALEIEAESVDSMIGITCGETFTNPEAGKSWRWCNYEDTSDTTFHWHLIADSDATKALAEAAKATATADGKSKTFVVQPTNYQVGDLWILQSDTDHTAGKKGDILTANTASEKYYASHWSKQVKYTDDTALENMEIGGRNLLRDSAIFTHKASASDNYSYKKLTPTVVLQPNTNYVFSVDKGEMTEGIDTAFTIYLFSSDIRTARNKLTIPISSTRQSVSFKTTAEVTDTDVVLIYAGQHGTTAGKAIKLTNIKLEKGTKATDWSPAPEDVDAKVSALDYLKKALEYDTDVIGGIVATTYIQLRDKTGEKDKAGNDIYKVNAGLSGVKDDNILMWGGGDYTDAVTAAKNSDPEIGDGTYNKGDGSEITTLIKKDGTGKIGCFHIINDNTIAVKSSDGSSEIFISAGENAQDTNIVIKQNDEVKVIVSGDVIDRNSVSAVELIGNYSSGEKITSPTQNIVVKNLNLQEGTGAWTAHFEADKIQVLFYQGVYSTIRRVRGYIDVYLCGKKILSTGLWTSSELSSSSVGNTFGFVGNITRFSTTNSSQQALEVRIRQMEVYRNGEWGSDYQDQLSLSSVRFCTKLSGSTYEDKKVILSNVSSSDIVQVGRNGVQVSHANGGFIQMLNDNKDLYVRMVGLPTTIPTGDDKDGMIYNWNGFLRVGGNSVLSADFTELGYNRFVLPRHIIIPNMEKHNSGNYEQNELNAFDDGDVFINN